MTPLKFVLMNMNGMDDEYMGLVAQKFPNNFTLLNDPNVYIADSGFTCHSTPHAMGFTNNRTESKCNESMHPKMIGNIPVVQNGKI